MIHRTAAIGAAAAICVVAVSLALVFALRGDGKHEHTYAQGGQITAANPGSNDPPRPYVPRPDAPHPFASDPVAPQSDNPEPTQIERTLSLQERVAAADVIVVASPLDSAPAKGKSRVPGDPPEEAIRFRVTRVLKGELADKVITMRCASKFDKLAGKEWVLLLTPGYLAGKDPYGGGICGLWNTEFESRIRPMLPGGSKPAPATQTADKPGDSSATLEKKLYGSWRDDNPCPGGQLILNADGTYERLRYGPGAYHLTGTWHVRWDALPPTLVLTCKTCNDPDLNNTPERYNQRLKLVQLDDESLVYQFTNDPQAFKCKCAKEATAVQEE